MKKEIAPNKEVRRRANSVTIVAQTFHQGLRFFPSLGSITASVISHLTPVPISANRAPSIADMMTPERKDRISSHFEKEDGKENPLLPHPHSFQHRRELLKPTHP